jgi:hypothetical protein
MFLFEDDDVVYIASEQSGAAAMYFNGSIYHNARATNEEIISTLNIMIHDSDVPTSQAALMSLIHMTIDVIKERHCS